jgi:uncharacterized protein YutE (UPF0331/DUF86 family)
MNKELILLRLAFIKEALGELSKLGSLSLEDFLDDKIKVAAAESYLRRALEAAFDIGRHLLVHQGWTDFSLEYKSIARGLGRKGVISSELEHKLFLMTGYRNRLVHFYHEVTPQELYSIIREDLDDLEGFTEEIAAYIS